MRLDSPYRVASEIVVLQLGCWLFLKSCAELVVSSLSAFIGLQGLSSWASWLSGTGQEGIVCFGLMGIPSLNAAQFCSSLNFRVIAIVSREVFEAVLDWASHPCMVCCMQKEMWDGRCSCRSHMALSLSSCKGPWLVFKSLLTCQTSPDATDEITWHGLIAPLILDSGTSSRRAQG